MSRVGDEFLAAEILGHGAYLLPTAPGGGDARGAGEGRIAALAERLGLRNEFDPGSPPARESFALLRRQDAIPADIADHDLEDAGWVIHVSSSRREVVTEFSDGVSRILAAATGVKALRGVIRPRNYTGAAMSNWAYARQVVQQAGAAMPHAFLVPLSKTSDWWRKDWMERHTYFLPRYDDQGRMLSEGHALATEAGISVLLRRTYRHETQPAPDGAYDFLTYFECAGEAVPTFHQVCAALRDVTRNPEWRFVREGPTWHGLRVPRWADLFSPPRDTGAP
jgi:hypothetical protein